MGCLASTRGIRECSQPDDTHLLTAVANILGAAIANSEARVALAQSTSLVSTVFDASSDLILVIDHHTNVFAASPSLTSILGHDVSSILRRDALDYVHPDDRGKALVTLARVLERNRVPLTVELRVRHADGSWRTLEAVGRATGGDGSLIVLNARDVSERRVVEQRILQSQKLEAVGRVAASVAHDLNNILQAINFAAREIGSEGHEIATMVEQAARLSRALLSFARDNPSPPSVVDIALVLERMTPMLRRLVGRHISLQLHSSVGPVVVYADPLEVEQITINLVVNARDAMSGGGNIAVTISSQPQFGIISVQDDGCGIDEATRARMFEPFFTTKSGRGTGLGLATVQTIVARRGGHIAVESALGEGTTFTILLPSAPSR